MFSILYIFILKLIKNIYYATIGTSGNNDGVYITVGFWTYFCKLESRFEHFCTTLFSDLAYITLCLFSLVALFLTSQLHPQRKFNLAVPEIKTLVGC